jgi:branched-chain amino acid transport system permease protein
VLVLLVTRTQFGRAMRAVAQNPVAARLVGIDVDRIISLTFVLGGSLAGAASIIYAFYNNTVFFQMGYRVGIDAFTAAVLSAGS